MAASLAVAAASFRSVFSPTSTSGDKQIVPKVGELPVRRLSISVMDWLASEGHIHKEWRNLRHAKLDFSAATFNLETFQPFDFDWAGRQGEEIYSKDKRRADTKHQLEGVHVDRVSEVNMDNNRLTDDLFDLRKAEKKSLSAILFGRLRILSLQHNLLKYPVVLLPALKELYLGHNQIIRMPLLAGLPHLEVLSLPDNQIVLEDTEDLFESGSIPKFLKFVDLSSNKLDLVPSRLARSMEALKVLNSLETFHIRGNPLCVFFPEYQALVLRCVPNLMEFDDLNLSKDSSLKKELLAQADFCFGYTFRRNEPQIVDDHGDLVFDEMKDLLWQELGVDIKKSEDARKYLFKDRLAAFDKIVDDRKAARKRHQNIEIDDGHHSRNFQKGLDTEERVPYVSEMIKEFDEAIVGHTDIMIAINSVFERASNISCEFPDNFKRMFDDFEIAKNRHERVDKDEHNSREEASVTLMQQIGILYERYPDSRSLLIRTLAKLAPVPCYRLGELSFVEIFACARNSEESRTMVLDAISEMLVPIIIDKNLSHPSFAIVLAGLSKCDVYGLSERLKPVVPKLMSLVKSSAYERELHASLHVLLRCAVECRDCAILVPKEENFGYLVREVIDRENFRHPQLFAVFENIVGTIRSCLRHCHIDVLKELNKLEEKGNDGKSFIFHKSLLHNFLFTVRAHMAPNSKMFDLELQPQLLRKLGAVIELITDLTIEERVMRDLLDTDKAQDNPYMNLIVGNPVTGGICRNSQADPVLLTAAFRFLTVLLLPLQVAQHHSEHSASECLDCARKDVPWVRDKYLPFIIENLRLEERDQNVAFRCIDLRHFSQTLQKCEGHSALSEADSNEIMERPAKSVSVRDSLSTNFFAHGLIIAVVNFLSIWGKLDDVYEQDSKLYKLVRRTSKRIDEDGRERLLFALLEIPSVDVQDVVVRCLGNTNIEELDDNEVQSLLNLLDPTNVAHKERLLASILERLGEFLKASGAGADKFRSRFAAVVIDTTFKVLAKNASRLTYNNLAEETDKVCLSLRGADVLRIASDLSQHLLWRHMRTFEVADCFREILKGEELSNSLQSPDVLVEITWTGRNVELLCSCLSGNYHTKLDNRKKQGFRVLSRIADVICGVMDTPENVSRSVEVRASAEAAMWKDRLIRRDMCAFEKILIDTSRQQETYNAFRCFELTLNFVEAGQLLEDDALLRRTSVGKSSFLAKLVGLKEDVDEALKKLHDYADRQEEKLVEAEKLRKSRDAPVEIVLTEALKPKGLKVGEKFLNAFFAQCRRGTEGVPTQLAHFGPIVTPRKLDLFGGFYLEKGQPEVRVAYSLAALLRTVYGMLIVPCDERNRHEIIQILRVPAILLRLIALVESRRSLCTCNVGAKLLRVFSEALKLQAGQDVPDGDGYIECLLIASKWAGTCLEYAKPLLQGIGSYNLTEEQMHLCTEAIRMLRSVASVLCRMKLGVTYKVQEEIVQEALRFAFPSTTLVTIVLCLVYDLEMSGPCSRTFDLLVKSSIARSGIRDLCSEVLAHLLHACPPVRYEVLESFNHLEVFGGYSIRDSYIAELMDRVQVLLYMSAIDLVLQNPEHPRFIKDTERVLVAVDIELPLKRVDWFEALTSFADLPPAQMLLLTTDRILVMDRPVHAAQATKCGHCPAESFCPAGPTIHEQHEYKELTRIISGPDRQALMIGYVQYSRAALHSNMTPFDRINGEFFEMIICHKSYKRKAVADTLCALSGPTIDRRVKLEYDEGLYHCLASYIDNALCFHFVFIEGSKFRLIVLEKERFSTLEIRFDLWRPPLGDLLHVDEANIAAGANRVIAPGGLVRQDSAWQTNHDQSRDKDEVMEALGIAGQTRQGDTFGDKSFVDTIRQRAKMSTARKYDGQRCDPSMVRLDDRQSMSDLEQVDFAHGGVPLLTLAFKANGTTSEFPIRFLDDMSRDEWRRSLASILNESASFERHH